MTEENTGFNPQITNNAEVGEQNIAGKIVKGDEVQGHKGNVVDTGGGSIEGDVDQTYNEAANEVVEYVDNLEAEFNKAVAEESGDVAPREIPAKEEVDAVITPFEEFDVESIDADNPDPPQVFSAMRSMAAAPSEAVAPEKAEGLFSRFKTMATKAGPKVGKALLAGSIAFAKGTVKQHPMYAGIQAGLESFQD